MVVPDRDGLAGVGFEGFDVSAEDGLDHVLFELGFFFRELGFVAVGVMVVGFVVVIVGVGEGEVVGGGVEEEVF